MRDSDTNWQKKISKDARFRSSFNLQVRKTAAEPIRSPFGNEYAEKAKVAGREFDSYVNPSSVLSKANDDETAMSDREWLSEAFRANEIPLMGYANHLLRDSDRARDVVQDTFFRLCKQRRSDIEGSVRQWLFRVCRNRALDVLKKENRMKVLDESVSQSQQSREGEPQRLAEQQDDAAKASCLLEALPQRQQEVIRLKIQGNLSYLQISELTGLSVSNVGYLLSTGLKKVRLQMGVGES